MKVRLMCAICVLVLIVPVVSYGSSWVFGVKPGFGVQSSYFGLSYDRITPYFGLDLLNIGAKWEEKDVDWQEYSPTGQFYKYHEGEDNLKGSATLVIPHFGIKLHLADKEKSLRPYLIGDLFKAFAFVNVEGKEVDRYYNPQGQITYEYVDEYGLEKNEEEFIKSLLGVWGFILAFGADYSFSEHFSVGGEYGVRLFFTSGDQEQKDSGDSDYDGIDDWRSEWKEELSGTLKMSYAVVVLNFHF